MRIESPFTVVVREVMGSVCFNKFEFEFCYRERLTSDNVYVDHAHPQVVSPEATIDAGSHDLVAGDRYRRDAVLGL